MQILVLKLSVILIINPTSQRVQQSHILEIVNELVLFVEILLVQKLLQNYLLLYQI